MIRGSGRREPGGEVGRAGAEVPAASELTLSARFAKMQNIKKSWLPTLPHIPPHGRAGTRFRSLPRGSCSGEEEAVEKERVALRE